MTGGTGEDGGAINSTEFFDLSAQSWTLFDSMVHNRTMHGMALINGLPAVLGGANDDAFLQSIEFLDDLPSTEKDASSNPALKHSWRLSSTELTFPRQRKLWKRMAKAMDFLHVCFDLILQVQFCVRHCPRFLLPR